MKSVKYRKYVYKIRTGNDFSEFLTYKDNYLVIANSNYSKLNIDFNRLAEVIPLFSGQKYNYANFCINKNEIKVFINLIRKMIII